MKRSISLLYIIGVVGAFFFSACSQIDADERLIDMEGVTAQRKVLLEDYTGQFCMNCPKVHGFMETLHKEYGDNVVMVSVHALNNGKTGGVLVEDGGLMLSLVDAYTDKFDVEALPAGIFNHTGIANSDTLSWRKAINDAIEQPSNVHLEIAAKVKGLDLEIDSKVVALDELSGSISLWVLEDSIVAPQRQPDGSMNMKYVHNHVLRAVVNGTWGENITLTKGGEKQLSHTLALDSTWVAKNLSVVAFVEEGTSGVSQAEKCSVLIEE